MATPFGVLALTKPKIMVIWSNFSHSLGTTFHLLRGQKSQVVHRRFKEVNQVDKVLVKVSLTPLDLFSCWFSFLLELDSNLRTWFFLSYLSEKFAQRHVDCYCDAKIDKKIVFDSG